jgi:hypothetical protein
MTQSSSRPVAIRRYGADIAALVVLAVLVLIFFWKIALTNRVLVGLDVFTYFYPYHDFASEALRMGRLPLWNPYLFMGAPLLANSQAAVLYPLHWPLLWLSTPKQIAWSIVLHVWLASAGTYLLARKATRLHPLAAFVTAAIFALGGFIGAQVEHVNQLNASAWLPWLLLCVEATMGHSQRRGLALLGGGIIVGLMFLAGHTQAAYIVLFGAAVYAVIRGVKKLKERKWLSGLTGLGMLAAMGAIGAALAAGQLLPTLELSRLSVRSSGLPYDEAASFSLSPGLIFKAFLPPLAWQPPFSEYVAYVGLFGLALALVGTWAILRQKRPGGTILVLALAGVFLAFGIYNPIYYLLYKLVPGFDLFRAPARWLLLYSFGTALLAGIGLEAWPKFKSWKSIIALLLVIELFLAGQRLAYNKPTTPVAFNSMRTAPAHLLADKFDKSGSEPFRFLSMSDIRYDPGDLGDLQAMYHDQLSEQAIYDLIVATKMKEVLAFNLPLRYRLASVDGYDGGLLPIKDYVTLERLFLSEDEIWPDGRLRQQLCQVPPARLLSLLNVKYIITDKTQDVWIDDVFYDLEHTVPLGNVTLADLPDFETTGLGIVSYLTDTTELGDGTPVARVTITDTKNSTITMTLFVGEHTAEGLYGQGPVAHRQARVSHHWRNNEQGNDYIAMLELDETLHPEKILIESLLPDERFHLRGVTLVDNHTGTNRNISIDPAYRLVHSGDVKIYQNLIVLPRAFVVHQVHEVTDKEQALAVLGDPGFDPADTVILLSEKEREYSFGAAKSTVDLITYEPETIRLQVSLDTPGYLVLTDAHYPGWVATVDGQTADIHKADLYFRAVALDSGEHQVTLQFQPRSVRWGLAVSLVAWLAWGIALAIMPSRIGRKRPSSV